VFNNSKGFLYEFIDLYLGYIKNGGQPAASLLDLLSQFKDFESKIVEYIKKKYPQISWLLLLKYG